MNIVVTIPKNRLAQVEAEEKEVENRIANGEKDICYYWTLNKLPVSTPERIYFVWNKAIRAYHEVLYLEIGKIYMKPEIHNLKTPIPMKGFQGWRYFDKDIE
jgi:hypothetical protein